MSDSWESPPTQIEAVGSEVHLWRIDLERSAAHDALRRVLARYLRKNPARIELRMGKHGKPALSENPPRLRFNLSHSGCLALVVVTAEREVGVDVEAEAPGRDFARLAEIGLDEAAAAVVRASPPEWRAQAFYSAWVRREAVAKCFGTGLATPLPNQPVVVQSIDAGQGYAAAIVVTGTEPLPIRRFAEPPPVASHRT